MYLQNNITTADKTMPSMKGKNNIRVIIVTIVSMISYLDLISQSIKVISTGGNPVSMLIIFLP
jgi:hypothetical protein